jgi:predicted glycosyltransferase
MKLAYLHPVHFKLPSVSFELNEPFALIRLSKLDAHHDDGIGGISLSFLKEIIGLVKEKMMVYITSEKSLSKDLDQYKLRIETDKIHYYLKRAKLLISDSQSMSVEAAMLGTPSIRISDFYGRISVLNELEEKYGLTFGFLPSDKTSIISKTKELLTLENIKQIFHERTRKMLDDKIDVTRFMVWFIENYPESARIMKENPEYQNRFK